MPTTTMGSTVVVRIAVSGLGSTPPRATGGILYLLPRQVSAALAPADGTSLTLRVGGLTTAVATNQSIPSDVSRTRVSGLACRPFLAERVRSHVPGSLHIK
jgi:hypothetical protein